MVALRRKGLAETPNTTRVKRRAGADPGGGVDWVSSHPPKSFNVDET